MLQVDGEPATRLAAALTELGRREITSLLLEGGAHLAGALPRAGEIDELRLFVAPLLLGGAARPAAPPGAGVDAIGEARRALAVEYEHTGEDVLIRARLTEW